MIKQKYQEMIESVTVPQELNDKLLKKNQKNSHSVLKLVMSLSVVILLMVIGYEELIKKPSDLGTNNSEFTDNSVDLDVSDALNEGGLDYPQLGITRYAFDNGIIIVTGTLSEQPDSSPIKVFTDQEIQATLVIDGIHFQLSAPLTLEQALNDLLEIIMGGNS